MHPGREPQRRVMDTLGEARRRRAAGRPVWDWFDRRVRGHMAAGAAMPFEAEPPGQAGELLASRLAEPATRPRSLYVHVPFCKRICTFCAFFRQPTGRTDLDLYTDAVVSQAKRLAKTRWASDGPPFDAVYFGGGTPTALESEQLVRIVAAICEHFPIAETCEFTVECRFDGLDPDYLRRLFAAGVNRLSFGVQSFDTQVRRSVGRIADRDTVLTTLESARQVGFEQLSVDLIYNLPGQASATWAADVEMLGSTPATAASIYALIPMRGSALVKQIEVGQARPLGDVACEYELFSLAHDALVSRDEWSRLSFQHFGDRSCERNVYNQVRSGGMDTLGLGSGAGGQIGSLSYMNPMDVKSYTEAETSGKAGEPGAFTRPAEAADLACAYRLVEGGGVERARLLELLPTVGGALDQLLELELLREEAGGLSLTRDGCFWGYNITAILTEAMVDAIAGHHAASAGRRGGEPRAVASEPAGVT